MTSGIVQGLSGGRERSRLEDQTLCKDHPSLIGNVQIRQVRDRGFIYEFFEQLREASFSVDLHSSIGLSGMHRGFPVLTRYALCMYGALQGLEERVM